jgi:peptidoglycan/xylan/chitin deacetylase (PgdA/CDA1 family)
MSSPGAVFLMYHELELPGRALCEPQPGYVRYVVREPEFRRQMAWLRQSGWKGVSVGESLSFSEQKRVALTFDDGCETDLLAAAPVLREAGFGATFYVTVGFIGKAGYMNAAQVLELHGLGFEIGSHAMTHAYLTDLDATGLHHEIAEAKRELEGLLGEEVKHFSCPGGRYNLRVIQTARDAGYHSLATSRVQVNSASTSRFALGRVAIQRETTLPEFQQICTGKGLWKFQVRNFVQDAAKALIGNRLYERARARALRSS